MQSKIKAQQEQLFRQESWQEVPSPQAFTGVCPGKLGKYVSNFGSTGLCAINSFHMLGREELGLRWAESELTFFTGCGTPGQEDPAVCHKSFH
jgi:hypothetical protein